MSRVHTVRLRGEPVAVVVDGEARIVASLGEGDAITVKGMCLFAMEVQAGAIDAPYTNARALTYARLANARRARTAGAR
jgi:hypothetical protein